MPEKTALVLSAGGTFAAYQAGVWKAIAAVWQPDLVIGASAGALNAWVIAGGGSPDQLVDHWTNPEEAGLLRFRGLAVPGRGFFDTVHFESSVKHLFHAYSARMPVGVVTVELAGFRASLVQDSRITWRHLAASCSIPVLLPPQRIDGRRYIDGGLLNALPLWAAREMGATRAVAIDVMHSNPSRMLRLARAALRRLGPPEPSPSGDLKVVYVLPSEPLGPLRHSLWWQSGRIRRWIDLGSRDGHSITMRLNAEL